MASKPPRAAPRWHQTIPRIRALSSASVPEPDHRVGLLDELVGEIERTLEITLAEALIALCFDADPMSSHGHWCVAAG
jgi:hypothetical protein